MKISLKYSVFIIICFNIYNAKSQNLKLTINSSDKTHKIEKELSEVSNFLISNCKKVSNMNYYKDIFHLQLLTTDYQGAITSIDNYIDSYAIDRLRTGNVFIYSVFANAKYSKIKSDKSFN